MSKSSFFIIGKHAVLEALKNPKRKVLRLFLTEESKKTIHRNSPRKNLLKDQKIFFKTIKSKKKTPKSDNLIGSPLRDTSNGKLQRRPMCSHPLRCRPYHPPKVGCQATLARHYRVRKKHRRRTYRCHFLSPRNAGKQQKIAII